MKKNLVLVETLHTGSGLEIIKAAIAQQIHIHFLTAEIDWLEKNVPDELKRLMSIIRVDWNTTTVKDEFIKLRKSDEPFILYTQRDGYIEAVTRVAEEFGLPFTPAKAVHIARNKDLARELFQNTEIASPKYMQAETLDEFFSVVPLMTFPFVVKPAGGSGSKDD